MDTNSKQFKDALQNLTTAFFQFLNVVNPERIDREAEIQFIAQSMQTISAHMSALQGISVQESQIPDIDPSRNNHEHKVESLQPKPQTTQVTVSSSVPEHPNRFSMRPSYNKRGSVWVFERFGIDGPTKLFSLFIGETDGFFELKAISPEVWQEFVYENHKDIFVPDVIQYDGEISTCVKVDPVERGIVQKEDIGGLMQWRIVKPCRVKVTPV